MTTNSKERIIKTMDAKQTDSYCGFLCSDIIERQQKIIDDLKDFAEYNPGFAQVMLYRITLMCLDQRQSKLVTEYYKSHTDEIVQQELAKNQ